MATTTEAQQRAALNLKTISSMLDDLPEMVAEWEEVGEGERVAWTIDWSNEMAGFERLQRDASEGALTPGQLVQYRELLARLQQAIPVLDQLDLYRPSVLLGA